ncbi:DUF2470 domain-containing protein [Nocardioides euryhalodurans]|uniref:DUF2470 domain-containing protein n=1 Tax=Nocardioides euryhalodurans TaxID=2518370 RepID=A0A4P7GL77_9ACTN|nr:DUF2470 domain-containing protein [Nocardioides euryhalodurans]QBR92589.1 DUF2470 domain-containing protein [Nocardioides euryhalodurans]
MTTVATLTAGRCPRAVTVVRIEPQPDGHPLLHLGATSPVHRLLAACPVATLAVPGPDPYRALALTGPVLPRRTRDGSRTHRMSLVSARLIGPEVLPIPLTAFIDAAPDPLHRHAAATLQHLETAHAAELLSCLRAHGHRDTRAVVPRGLDRYGLEVAAITDDGVCRLRLPFPGGPVDDLGQVAAGLRLLLTCRCRGEGG